MIFNRISLKNFGPYLGECHFDTAIKGNQNVTLVHAQNYVGKTSLLRGIIWCLYNKIVPDDNKQDVDVFNDEALMSKDYECSVTIDISHEKKDYQLVRKVVRKFYSNGKQEDISTFNCLQISKDGHHQPILKAQDFVYEMAPEPLSKFFFLKGENSPFTSNELDLSSSIKEILGINLMEQGLIDIKSIEAGIRRSSAQFIVDDKLKAISQRISDLEEEIEKSENQVISLTSVILELKKDIQQYEEKLGDYQKTLGEKKRLNDLSASILKEKQTIERLENKNAQWMRRGLYSLVADKLLTSGLSSINTEISKGKLPSPYQETFITDILNDEKCICGHELSHGTPEYLKVESLLSKGGDTRVLNGIIEAKGILITLESSRSSLILEHDNNSREIEASHKMLEQLENTKKELEKTLGLVDDEKIRALLTNKKTAESMLLSETKKCSLLQARTSDNKKLVEDLKKDYSLKASENSDAKKRIELARFTKYLLDYADETLNELQKMARSEVQAEMTKIVNDSLTKPPKISISEKFTYEVEENYYLSGGPKRVLDLAFTASIMSFNKKKNELLETSGFVIPLVIDSAFGETDDEYRQSIAKFLPELSSQLIVLVSGTQAYKFAEGLIEKVSTEYILKRETRDSQSNINSGRMLVRGVEISTWKFNCPQTKTYIERL